ncbi:hypothetical protein Tco_0128164 [Tanacetum coccineum]
MAVHQTEPTSYKVLFELPTTWMDSKVEGFCCKKMQKQEGDWKQLWKQTVGKQLPHKNEQIIRRKECARAMWLVTMRKREI